MNVLDFVSLLILLALLVVALKPLVSWTPCQASLGTPIATPGLVLYLDWWDSFFGCVPFLRTPNMLHLHVGLCVVFLGPGNGRIGLVCALALFDMNRLFVLVFLFASIVLHDELPFWVGVGSCVYRQVAVQQVMLFAQLFVELVFGSVVRVLLGLAAPLRWFVLALYLILVNAAVSVYQAGVCLLLFHHYRWLQRFFP